MCAHNRPIKAAEPTKTWIDIPQTGSQTTFSFYELIIPGICLVTGRLMPHSRFQFHLQNMVKIVPYSNEFF
jgi:hypothetical protein